MNRLQIFIIYFKSKSVLSFILYVLSLYFMRTYSTGQDCIVRRQVYRDIQRGCQAAVSHRRRTRTGSNMEGTRRYTSTKRPTEAITRGIVIHQRSRPRGRWRIFLLCGELLRTRHRDSSASRTWYINILAHGNSIY